MVGEVGAAAAEGSVEVTGAMTSYDGGKSLLKVSDVLVASKFLWLRCISGNVCLTICFVIFFVAVWTSEEYVSSETFRRRQRRA